MTIPSENPQVATKKRRVDKRMGWAIAGAVVLVMFGLMFIARGPHPPAQSGTQNTATQQQN